MKRQAMEDVVDKYMRDIEKCSNRLPGSFDTEDNHDLRVAYKKIRAFLRLLQLESNAGDLRIPAGLKALYHSAGNVRDIQLFLEEINRSPVAADLPSFVNCYNQKLFTYKEEAVEAIEAAHLKKITHSIKKKLPHQLQDDTVRKFSRRKVAAIHILLLAVDNETDLHSIRKQLKDIIYTIRIYEHDWGVPFPAVAWKSEKELNDMASTLGDFNDRCLAVSLLQSECSDTCNIEERRSLFHLQKNWTQQKEEQKQQLLQQVQELQVKHELLKD